MMRIRRGFGLVELIVVIGIIALLTALLIPTLISVKQQAIGLKCMSQMRQLGNAVVLYVNDNRGWLPSSDTCGPLTPQNFYDASGSAAFSIVDSSHTWVGWVDGGPTAPALENGTLWKYLKNASLYKCPADTNFYRTRTYSMNAFMCAGNPGVVGTYFNIYKIAQSRTPSSTIAFAEEIDPRSSGSGGLAGQWNVNGWLQFPPQADLYPALAPTQDYWGDLAASWHRGGANFTFLDGHSEYWKFSDVRTVNSLKNDPTWPNPYYHTANNLDLIRIKRSIAPWGVQRIKRGKD